MPRTRAPETVESVEVTLTLKEAKRNSVRYDAPPVAEGEPRPAITAIYLGNAAAESLGHPEHIRLSIARGPVA